jgi:hypothetical protein
VSGLICLFIVLIFIIIAENEPVEPVIVEQNSSESSSSTTPNLSGNSSDTAEKSAIMQIKAIFATLLRSVSSEERRKLVKLCVNKEEREYTLADDIMASNARRHLFLLKGVEKKDLYWYDEFAALMSTNKMYLSMCCMSNGDVMLSVFMTRYDFVLYAIIIPYLT